MAPGNPALPPALCLLCRIASSVYALPLTSIVEVMRPLPIESMPAISGLVRGFSRIRGNALPVLDLAAVIGGHSACPTRLIVARSGERCVALLADDIIGIRRVATGPETAAPPLLHNALGGIVSDIACSDGDFLHFLGQTCLVPPEVFAAIEKMTTDGPATGRLIATG